MKKSELKELIKESVREVLAESAPTEGDDVMIFGLKSLADFLNVSWPTAQALVASGKIPHQIAGKRKMVFLRSEVINAIKKNNLENLNQC